MKQRIYIDTSVIGGCEDEEFSKWSSQLFGEFREGLRIAVISDLTRQELEKAPKSVKEILSSLPESNFENVFLTEEAEDLARDYIDNGVLNISHVADAQHIAIASIERVDVSVSWNFQQIVNLDRIRAFNSVNLKMGYPVLEIRSPREVIYEEKFDAVKFQRKVRKKLSKKYNSSHDEFLLELKEKYGYFKKQKVGTENR